MRAPREVDDGRPVAGHRRDRAIEARRGWHVADGQPGPGAAASGSGASRESGGRRGGRAGPPRARRRGRSTRRRRPHPTSRSRTTRSRGALPCGRRPRVWEPGITRMQPFSVVESSIAIHAVVVARGRDGPGSAVLVPRHLMPSPPGLQNTWQPPQDHVGTDEPGHEIHDRRVRGHVEEHVAAADPLRSLAEVGVHQPLGPPIGVVGDQPVQRLAQPADRGRRQPGLLESTMPDPSRTPPASAGVRRGVADATVAVLMRDLLSGSDGGRCAGDPGRRPTPACRQLSVCCPQASVAVEGGGQ